MTLTKRRLAASMGFAAWLILCLATPQPSLIGQNCTPIPKQTTPLGDLQASWCAKPIGAGIRDFCYDLLEPARDFAKHLTSKEETYLLISMVTRESLQSPQLKEKVDQNLIRTPEFQETLKQIFNEHPEFRGRFSMDEAATLLLDKFGYSAQDVTGQYIFFYSPSERFRTVLRIDGLEKGACIQANGPGLKYLLSAEKNNPILELIQSLRPQMVLLDGVDLPKDFEKDLPSRPAVFGTNHTKTNYLQQISMVSDLFCKTSPSVCTVANLLPLLQEEAKPWKFSEEKAYRYAVNGQRIEEDLRAMGYGIGKEARLHKTDILKALRCSLEGGKLTLLIGETFVDGTGIRIPGTADILMREDLTDLPSLDRLLVLSCNSQKFAGTLGCLSVVGTLWSDKTLSVLRCILADETPGTATEYLNIPIEPSTTSTEKDLPTILSELIRELGEGPPSASESEARRDLKMLALFKVNKSTPITSSKEEGTNITFPPQSESDTNHLYLFLVALIGGSCREVLRWRRLLERKRHRAFLKGKYLAITVTEILLGGCAGMIFAPFVPLEKAIYPTAFVAGAGLETLVKWAAQLRIWVPNVPQGAKGELPEEEPTMLEFLRA